MVSAALWASPRSDSLNLQPFAADKKASSYFFSIVGLSVLLQYVNRGFLLIFQQRFETDDGFWDELKDLCWCKSLCSSYTSGSFREVTLASTPELLAEGAHKLILYKCEHALEPINQFNGLQSRDLEISSCCWTWRPSLASGSQLRDSLCATDLHSASIRWQRISSGSEGLRW